MDLTQVAIIGADCISVSIALGLKAQETPPRIVGCDADAQAANLARSKGAFDQVERWPERACRNANLVIVAVPLPAIGETFAAIAPSLQPGCFVTDTAPLKAPVMRWAEERLPENVFFVGGHPIPNPAVVGSTPLEGLEAASSDLLRGALYCLTTPIRTSGTAIDVFTGLATMLGATPFFIDVTEHDGLQAGVEGLADLLAIALLRATVDTPGWQEMRKFAGHRFAAATAAASDARERHLSVFLNREHILRRLNSLLSELVRLRDMLTEEDAETLEQAFVATADGRERWIEERGQGMWLKERAVRTDQIPSRGEQLGQMIFGGYAASRLKKGTEPPRKK
jgi:prephenate dehydrogenase